MMKKLSLLVLCAGALFAQSLETRVFRAVLSPRNEVPALDLDASGWATVHVHVMRDANGAVVSGSADFQVGYGFPAAVTITGLHIHSAPAGTNGPVTIDSGINAAGPVANTQTGTIVRQGQVRPGTTQYDAGLATLRGLLDNPGNYYVNLHTTDNPGGAIRGQLMAAREVVLMGLMSPRNEVPAIADLDASGVGYVTAIATWNSTGQLTSGQVRFVVTHRFPGQVTFTGLHIHDGPAGVNGPVTIGTNLSAANPSISQTGVGTVAPPPVEINLTNAAQVRTFETMLHSPQGFYINLHSLVNPGGAIRAQLSLTDRNMFPVRMLSSNEVPPVPGEAQAPGFIRTDILRAADGTAAAGLVTFNVGHRLPGRAQFTGFHIHEGVAGENGPVRINTGLAAADNLVTETGFGNLRYQAPVSEGAALAALNGILTNPAGFYANLHTSDFPGGVVRAQLPAVSNAAPTTSILISGIGDPTRTAVARGGLGILFGNNFTRVTASIDSLQPTAAAPTTLHGTSVTIGGVSAPIISVDATSMILQVPFETPTGSQPIVVRNASGSSTPLNVAVSETAPAIYFDETGGAVSRLDYTLVRPESPASAGDSLWVFATGLGQTAAGNRLETGRRAVFSDATRTAAVTVTLGGRPAEVLFSLPSPGYIGLYQVLIRVPSGLSAGNQPLVLSMGEARSNSVNLAVR